MTKDYYSILGIDKSATDKEIKNAYRKLALKFHPDKNQNDPFFEAKFKELKEAYDYLIKYHGQSASNFQKPPPKQNQEPTPGKIVIDILKNLLNLSSQTNNKLKKEVKIDVIQNYLNRILSSDVLPIYLMVPQENKKELIFNIVLLLRFLKKKDRDNFEIQLIRIAGTDNDLIVEIDQKIKYHISRQKRKELINRIAANWLLIGFVLLIAIIYFSPDENKSPPSNLVSDNQKIAESDPQKYLENYNTENKVYESKWRNNKLKTGESPYNGIFGRGVYDKNFYNKITVKNGQNTDVIVCLTQYYNPKKTIRNEYIRAGDSFEMTNIPNGVYYLKTFYGNYWNPDTVIMGNIHGFFDLQAGFSKSDNYNDLLKLEQKTSKDSKIEWSIYEVTLYPIEGGNMESEPINVSEFFKK